MNRLLYIILFSICAFSGQAQFPFGIFADEFQPIPVGNDDGISNTTEKYFFEEDDEGVVWICTDQGLIRYDGFQAINVSRYFKSKFPDLTLSAFVEDVEIDDLRQLWMATPKGLSVYDLKNGTFKNIYLDDAKYPENMRNNLIQLEPFGGNIAACSRNGVYIIDIHTLKVIESYLTDGEAYDHRQSTTHTIHAIYPNFSDSMLYIQASGGMHVINHSSHQRNTYKADFIYKEKERYWGDHKHWFYQGAVLDSMIYSASWGAGIVGFNMNTNTFSNFFPDPTHTLKPNRNILKSLRTLNDSTMIVNSHYRGLYFFNHLKRQLTEIEGSPSAPFEPLIDSHGHYWIGAAKKIFRSNRQLARTGEKYRSLQIGEAFSNGQSLGFISFENKSEILLEEIQDKLKLLVSLSHPFDIEYQLQYSLCNREWKTIENNMLHLESINGGHHTLSVRAVVDQNIFETKVISIYKYVPWYKRWYYIALCLLGLALLTYVISNYRIKQALEKEKIKSDYEIQIAKLNTSALRSRMNPHFLFNTLNSIKHHVLFKNKDETGDYITDFSFLIRGILEYSELDYISLRDDIEWIQKYLDIEKRRFRTPFSVEILIDPNIDLENEDIPPLLIQPFVENALWHGLLHKEDKDNKISLSYTSLKKGYQVTIADNGIGRKAAQNFKTDKEEKKSLGMVITEERIEQISKLNRYDIAIDIKDLYDEKGNALGTKIILTFKRK